MGELNLSAPQKLGAQQDLISFDSGEKVLDDWLRRRALQNETRGASRTYVVCASKTVAGFYSLAVGAISHGAVSGNLKRNMPHPIPVMILGRLAVDRTFQGRGIGKSLLREAILRTRQAAEIAGIRALLVHAISDEARRFYLSQGFHASPVDPMTVMITMEESSRITG